MLATATGAKYRNRVEKFHVSAAMGGIVTAPYHDLEWRAGHVATCSALLRLRAAMPRLLVTMPRYKRYPAKRGNAQFAVWCIYRSNKPPRNRVRKWWETNCRQPRILHSNNQKFVGTIFLDIFCSADYSPN